MEKIIIPMLRVGKSTALSRIPARVVFKMLQQPKNIPIRAAKAGFLFPVITAGVTFENKAETKGVTVATVKETIRNCFFRLGYTEDYIRSIFKKITGKTPLEFLTDIRVKQSSKSRRRKML